MSTKFELSGLSGVFNEAIERREQTLVFDVKNGRGRFLFMMFFDDDDVSTKDDLFIYLRNSKQMLRVKLYGNHLKGQFLLWLSDRNKQQLIEELQLNQNSSSPFSFEGFFSV